jgi:hypothetical protein
MESNAGASRTKSDANSSENGSKAGEQTSKTRPFTAKNFDQKLNAFSDFIDQVTFRRETGIEDKRSLILETLRFDLFSARLQAIFETELDPANVKKLFKKICLNPDNNVEWSEVFDT